MSETPPPPETHTHPLPTPPVESHFPEPVDKEADAERAKVRALAGDRERGLVPAVEPEAAPQPGAPTPEHRSGQ
jgi:hypothetical protein